MIGFSYEPEEYGMSDLSGVPISELYRNVPLQVETGRRTNKIIAEALDLPVEPPILTLGHVITPEYMGCEVFQPENDEPFVKGPIINHIREVEAFRCPDPPDNPVGRKYLQACKEFHELTGQKKSILHLGSFTTAAFMRGQTDFLVDWATEPELAERLVVLVTDAVIDWKKYHDAEMGIENEESSDLIDDSITLISPADFEAKVLPTLVRWFDTFPADVRYFHCCADVTRHLQALAGMGMTNYALMGEMMDPMEMKRVLGDIEMSQLADFRILRDGNQADVRRHILHLISRAPKDGSYTIVVEGAPGLQLETVSFVKDTVTDFNSSLPVERCV